MLEKIISSFQGNMAIDGSQSESFVVIGPFSGDFSKKCESLE